MKNSVGSFSKGGVQPMAFVGPIFREPESLKIVKERRCGPHGSPLGCIVGSGHPSEQSLGGEGRTTRLGLQFAAGRPV